MENTKYWIRWNWIYVFRDMIHIIITHQNFIGARVCLYFTKIIGIGWYVVRSSRITILGVAECGKWLAKWAFASMWLWDWDRQTLAMCPGLSQSWHRGRLLKRCTVSYLLFSYPLVLACTRNWDCIEVERHPKLLLLLQVCIEVGC